MENAQPFSFWGERVDLARRDRCDEICEGGLLYPNPAANLVGDLREELAF